MKSKVTLYNNALLLLIPMYLKTDQRDQSELLLPKEVISLRGIMGKSIGGVLHNAIKGELVEQYVWVHSGNHSS